MSDVELDIVVEDSRWDDLPIDGVADTAVRAALAYICIGDAPVELSVLACDDARISVLNADFRDKPSATNVLSWPAQELEPPTLPQPDFDGSIGLGDLALAYETCMREAREQGKTPQDHVTHLIVHGVLHLFGYDHERDIDATLMESAEVAILGKLGINDPYSVV